MQLIAASFKITHMESRIVGQIIPVDYDPEFFESIPYALLLLCSLISFGVLIQPQ